MGMVSLIAIQNSVNSELPILEERAELVRSLIYYRVDFVSEI